MNTSLTRQEGMELLLALSPTEAQAFARRTAEIAGQMGDLGAGIRGALQEIADARAKEAE